MTEATGSFEDPMQPNSVKEGDVLQASLADALGADFEVLRPLGGGATSHVYLAREITLRRLVAVKVLRKDVGENETARARFEREAHAAAGIRHPNVPAIHRIGRTASGLPFMVQEFIEGRTLADRMEAMGALGPQETRRIVGELAAALSASHARGVIHRDVRPDNVLIEQNTERAFLMDFGTAAVRETGAESGARLTRAGESVGDPLYASPEQVRGEKVTPQADVYSVGVLAYEMLTLSNPYGSRSQGELLSAHLGSEPKEIPWRAIGNDQALGEIVRRCLNKEPSRRPTAEELRRALSSGGSATHDTGHGREGDILATFPKLAESFARMRRGRGYRLTAAYGFVAVPALAFAYYILAPWSGVEWLHQAVVIAVLSGFPVVMIGSWLYGFTERGGQKPEQTSTGTHVRWMRIVGVVLVLLLAGAAGFVLLR